jgi:hypothetical protein
MHAFEDNDLVLPCIVLCVLSHCCRAAFWMLAELLQPEQLCWHTHSLDRVLWYQQNCLCADLCRALLLTLRADDTCKPAPLISAAAALSPSSSNPCCPQLTLLVVNATLLGEGTTVS